MKKILSILLAAALLTLAGCGSAQPAASSAPAPAPESASQPAAPESQPAESAAPESQPAPAERTAVRVGALKGPTAMGMVKLMEDAGSGSTANDYSFTVAGAIDEITPKLVQGELDIAAIPANLAAVLYQNTKGGVQTLSINTLGILNIVETGDSVHSMADLKGRTIYASGKGATPEYALNYLLLQNGIDPEKDVTIEWKSEHTECVAAITATEGGVAMLPQPFVTTAMMKNDKIRVAVDMNKEWEALQSSGALITTATVVRADFAKEHPEAVAAFMDEYRASTEYVNADVEGAAALCEQFDIIPAAVAQKALPACNIVYIDGDEMQTQLSGYLEVLMEQNPKAVGGALPDEAFYYHKA